jgi:endonuclease III related protein
MAARRNANQMHAPARLRRMHDMLLDSYGPQQWWPAKTAFEVVLGAYLTQNTSWRAVERTLANLRKADALSIDGVRRRSVSELQQLIRPSGFYTRKAPALKAFVDMLDKEFDGSLEVMAATQTGSLRERLLALPGVGSETADAILLYALGHAVPVVDEYLRRVVRRHGLLASTAGGHRNEYESLAKLTREAFKEDPDQKKTRFFGEFHALIVAVGKAHCSKQANCAGCPLAGDQHPFVEIAGPKIRSVL